MPATPSAVLGWGGGAAAYRDASSPLQGLLPSELPLHTPPPPPSRLSPCPSSSLHSSVTPRSHVGLHVHRAAHSEPVPIPVPQGRVRERGEWLAWSEVTSWGRGETER